MKKILSIILTICILSAMMVTQMFMSVSAAEYEYATYFGNRIYISQGYGTDSYSHAGTKAFDLTGSSFYAPFTGTVKKIYTNSNSIWFVSDNKVIYADGTVDYMTIKLTHMNDSDFESLGISLGKRYKQGAELYRPGVKGYVTGAHIHLEVAKGQKATWHATGYTVAGTETWAIGDSYADCYSPNDALYISENTNIAYSSYKGRTYSWIRVPFSDLTVKLTSLSDKCGTTNDNAVVYYNINKPSSWEVTKIGVKIRKDGSTYENGFTHIQNSNYKHEGKTDVEVSWDFKNELNYTLSQGTKYWLQFYAVVNGTEYWSDEYYFTTTGGHTHDYFEGAEWDHPHRIYKKCDCGEYYYTGATTNLDTCTICYPFEKPIVNIAQAEYAFNDTIEISWNEIEKASHYKLVISKKDSDGNYSENIITENKLTDTIYSTDSLSIGEYSINVYAYDNKNYNYSLDDWNYQKSEPIYFKICSFARYYDWTFNFDNAMKMMSDAMISDGDLNLAFQEYNKGFIGTVDIYDEENINHLEAPNRIGYKFIVWEKLLEPNQSKYDVSYTHYIYQAQYEQLSYSKGECLYGDTNFDGETNVLDLIRLKRILIGDSENHISADLDADEKINAIDISMLKRLLLGREAIKNIYFDANGGTVEETQRLVISGNKLGELPIPSRTGYDFTGWYTSDGTLLTSDTVMTTDSDITAIAKWSVKSYTYNIVYKSSNGTSLGTATAKYNFGTTNTISPKSFTGYTTPSSQSIKWDSTTAKTITFVYVPKSVPNSQNVKTGSWWYYDGEDRIIYSVNVEYQNRTSNSVQLRFVWTNTIDAYYRYGYTQTFYASANGVATGDVIICPNSEWSSSSSSARSKTAYSGWITVSITSTEEQTIKVLADYWDAFGKYSWGSYITIPAY